MFVFTVNVTEWFDRKWQFCRVTVDRLFVLFFNSIFYSFVAFSDFYSIKNYFTSISLNILNENFSKHVMFNYYHIEIRISLQQFDRTLNLQFKILEFAYIERSIIALKNNVTYALYTFCHREFTKLQRHLRSYYYWMSWVTDLLLPRHNFCNVISRFIHLWRWHFLYFILDKKVTWIMTFLW